MTARLFVAVVPPRDVIERLSAFVEPRRASGPELRWTLAESWHLTCAFLARVPEPKIPVLDDALAGVADRTAAFALTVHGAGAFPNPAQARALWLAVATGAGPLEQLALRCRTAAGRCGLDVEGGRFRPHLTLARASGIRADGWVRAFETIEPQSWLVDRFSLIQSQALPGGAGYRSLAEYRLAA